MILYMGIVLFAPAIALETVTGISKSVAILVIGAVCAFYSVIGGLKAVLLTDVFQSLLMFAAVFTVIISGVSYAGGFGEIFKAADEGGRLQLWKYI
jgi:sodium-coupled monocarboxylate transporter 8/12